MLCASCISHDDGLALLFPCCSLCFFFIFSFYAVVRFDAFSLAWRTTWYRKELKIRVKIALFKLKSAVIYGLILSTSKLSRAKAVHQQQIVHSFFTILLLFR